MKSQNNNMIVFDLLDQERKRISSDLHDTTLQNLTYLVHKIELAQMLMDKDPVQAKLELALIHKNLRSTINEIRNIVFELHPMTVDDLGMKAAFERLFSVINENKQYELDVQIEDVSCENKFILNNIYRVVQECFFNILKHSNADKIIFRCHSENEICYIYIEDNGKGFDSSIMEERKEKHFGILLVKDRVNLLHGKIQIDSEPNKGVKIFMEIPLN